MCFEKQEKNIYWYLRWEEDYTFQLPLHLLHHVTRSGQYNESGSDLCILEPWPSQLSTSLPSFCSPHVARMWMWQWPASTVQTRTTPEARRSNKWKELCFWINTATILDCSPPNYYMRQKLISSHLCSLRSFCYSSIARARAQSRSVVPKASHD